MGIRVKDSFERAIRYIMYNGKEVKKVFSGPDKVYEIASRKVYLNKGEDECVGNYQVLLYTENLSVIIAEGKVNDLVKGVAEFGGTYEGKYINIQNTDRIAVKYYDSSGTAPNCYIYIGYQQYGTIGAAGIEFRGTANNNVPLTLDIKWNVEKYDYIIEFHPDKLI